VPDISNQDLLADLGGPLEQKKAPARTAEQERVIAGFEDIIRFMDEHGRPPQHGEDRDIFERLYAVRLERLRTLTRFHELLAPMDSHGLLTDAIAIPGFSEDVDDSTLLADLGGPSEVAQDITQLRHVRSRAEIQAAEEISSRKRCEDFDRFKPLFDAVRHDLETGAREARKFGENAQIKQGEFFILGGQTAFVAEVPEELTTEHGHPQGRLRVIYDNGTEGDPLLRSFQRALYKEELNGRRITDPVAGPLFGSEAEEDDLASGTIYVLRSLSDHPDIAGRRNLIHKIGVTGGEVKARVANAPHDATYLLAGVEAVAEYKLYNINRTKLENLFHKVFAPARLEITLQDRFGHPVRPREWYLVPLHVIDEAVERIKDGSITDFSYDPLTATLKAT